MEPRRLQGSKRLAPFVRTAVFEAAVMCFVALSNAVAGQEALECKLGIGKGPFLTGEPILVQLELLNRTDGRIVAFKPGFQNEQAARLVIRGPGDKILPYWGEHMEWEGPPLVPLLPGKVVVGEEDITLYYGPLEAGRYQAYAICRLAEPKKEIRSNEVVFEVVKPNGRFLQGISVERRLSDGSSGGVVTWQVFTHEAEGLIRAYCRRALGGGQDSDAPHGPWVFVELGLTPSEKDISCVVDTDGKLHVLYRRDEEHYAHSIVSGLGAIESVDLYRPKEGMKPSLATKVYVQYAEKIRRDSDPE